MLTEIAHLFLHRMPCARRCVLVPNALLFAVGPPGLIRSDSMNDRLFPSNRP
jgi:hypothetical protein